MGPLDVQQLNRFSLSSTEIQEAGILAAPVDVLVPPMGESVSDGTIAAFLKGGLA